VSRRLRARAGSSHVGDHAVDPGDDQQEVFLVDVFELDARRGVGHQAGGVHLQSQLSSALAISRYAAYDGRRSTLFDF
jgi:hypothetical protein